MITRFFSILVLILFLLGGGVGAGTRSPTTTQTVVVTHERRFQLRFIFPTQHIHSFVDEVHNLLQSQGVVAPALEGLDDAVLLGPGGVGVVEVRCGGWEG